jgi:hypothetical protein
MSFEHYPYDPGHIQWSHLYDEPALISHILQVWRDDGLPAGVPMFITELNIAWAGGESFVDVFGALWLADYVGAFLEAGGDGLYYFHYLPERACTAASISPSARSGCSPSTRTIRSSSPRRSSSRAS